MQFYRNILLQAIQIVWRNKIFWFFGLFATFISTSGVYEVVMKLVSGKSGLTQAGIQRFIDTGIFSKDVLGHIKLLVLVEPFNFGILLFFYLVIIALIGFLFWLAIVSQVALVNESALIIQGEKNKSKAKKRTQDQIFQSGLDSGKKYFWPVLVLNIFLKIILFAVFAVISSYLLFTAGQMSGVIVEILNIIIFSFFIAIVLSIAFTIKYAIAFVIIKGSSFFRAIKQSFQLFYNNWFVSLELALVLFTIHFFVSAVMVLIVLVFSIPFLYFAVLFYQAGSLIGFNSIVGLGFVLLLLFIVIIGSITTSFQVVSWTRFFIELTTKGAKAKMSRVFEKKKKN